MRIRAACRFVVALSSAMVASEGNGWCQHVENNQDPFVGDSILSFHFPGQEPDRNSWLNFEVDKKGVARSYVGDVLFHERRDPRIQLLYATADQAHVDRGTTFVALGQYDRAATEFNEALRINSKNPRAYFMRGYLFAIQRDLRAAKREYTNSIDCAPDVGRAYVARGIVEQQLGYHDAALRDFRAATRIDTLDPIAHRHLAEAELSRRNYRGAAFAFERAVALDPAHSPTSIAGAWLRAACPDDSLRDAGIALRLAKLAHDRTQGRDADALAGSRGGACRGPRFRKRGHIPRACAGFNTGDRSLSLAGDRAARRLPGWSPGADGREARSLTFVARLTPGCPGR